MHAYSHLAVPGVLALILFLSFSSQYLFYHIDPEPLTRNEAIVFNLLIAALLICYARTVLTDPGHIPLNWSLDSHKPTATGAKPRWCRKCEAVKPPRAHHCKTCKRCIPKMDHHCPWTANCVSHLTFPHFLRFVGYASVAMAYLEYSLYIRLAIIWENKDMSSNFGPTVVQLVHIFALTVANSFTLFMLSILWIRSVWSLVANTFTIEGWEQERHSTLLRRARVFGGWLDGPDGSRIRIQHQEYPYDIGLWSNIVQGMGTRNVLAWFWPFAATPSIQSAVQYETNGFEDPVIGWPPPDPDRMPRSGRKYNNTKSTNHRSNYDDGDIVAFRLRQQEDLKRFNQHDSEMRKRQQFHRRYIDDPNGQAVEKELAPGEEGEESWRNAEGERLADWGVDEDVEFYDEENIPLAELIQRRKASGKIPIQVSDTTSTAWSHAHAIGSTRHQHAL
ncbi:hypothetical protein FKW77_009306 [Venturia effusa]|uniref:Palmitoyltransferase PFA4 n=1 Tax=Venturia effusa TaxID=50376 RepID=A0A517KX88_9PEZI|nr:hypothetical protein FKW77_009306 [Venturia effusa]